MKTLCLMLILSVILVSTSQAQTKKIALRSHSGNNSTFTIFVPDEFGRAPMDYPENRIILDKKPIIKKKDSTLQKNIPFPKITPEKLKQHSIILDTVLQCHPENDSVEIRAIDSVFQSTPATKPDRNRPTPSTLPDSILTLQETKAAPVVNRAMNFPKHEPTTMEMLAPPSKKGSLDLLVYLLCIPAILAFVGFVKKP